MIRRLVALLLNISVVTAAGLVTGCGSFAGRSDQARGKTMTKPTIEQIQEAHTDEWMAIPGVEGTAIGLHQGKPCILILASVEASQLRDRIPSKVQGYSVVIEETGTFRTLDP
ncbi:MAG: hypothetical protein K9N55_11095 [Phycisphaerae bacterium]|nr:hypothetical protein [Phycisphaerae bacterium]